MYYIWALKTSSMDNNTQTNAEENPNAKLDLAIDAIEDLKDTLKQLLSDEHDMVHIGFDSKLNLMANQLRMMTGATMVSKPLGIDTGPITEFMGDSIQRTNKTVVAEDLSPQEQELKIFREKVERLGTEFDTLSNDQILDSYKNEPNVVRGVAKLAGITDYKELPVDGKFIDYIRESRKSQAAAKVELDKTNARITKVDNNEDEDIPEWQVDSSSIIIKWNNPTAKNRLSTAAWQPT